MAVQVLPGLAPWNKPEVTDHIWWRHDKHFAPRTSKAISAHRTRPYEVERCSTYCTDYQNIPWPARGCHKHRAWLTPAGDL